jgi:SAM-dependent methyltransferase
MPEPETSKLEAAAGAPARKTPVDVVRERVYPETGAGGFSRADGTVAFYLRINALLRPDMTLLDFGAGRGSVLMRDQSPFRRHLRTFKGRVREVIGIDVDPRVSQNPFLDKAYHIGEHDALPLPDASVDLVIANWVFEHIGDPRRTASELRRILRPGGWICARTPNRWGYIGVASRLVPNRLHSRVLTTLQPGRKEDTNFPTFYRMNTPGALRALFPEREFEHFVYHANPEPIYFPRRAWLWRAVAFMDRITPGPLEAVMFAFLHKK